MDTKQLALFEVKEMTPEVRKTNTKKEETYEEFLEKFKAKHTTDECYTPKAVYDVVCNFVRKLPGVGNRPFVRPFYPGGDYENYEYQEGCIVVDNPPFSIYSKIVKFYELHKIDYFLFAPHLTVIVRNSNASYVITDTTIVYENGAKVNTDFVTSLLDDVKLWLCGELAEEIKGIQKKEINVTKYKHNENIITTALLGKYICSDTDIKIKRKQCLEVRNIDWMRRINKSLFGSGYIVSDEIKEALRAEALRAEALRAEALRAEALRADLPEVELSEREKKIVERLNKQSAINDKRIVYEDN